MNNTPEGFKEVVELMKATTASTSHRFLMEAFVLGRESHHALNEKRECLRTLEINERGLRDKLAAVGLYDDHPVSKQRMAELHAASESLDGDIRAEVAKLDADVAARIKALENTPLTPPP
jgi:hypothetical protein